MKKDLTISGVSVRELAREYSTPLYVYDEGMMASRMDEFTSNFRSDKFNTHVAYASKAFLCKAMARLVNKKGLCIDVVSGGELYTVLSAGFPAEKIYFHGNNKAPYELEYALKSGVGTIVADNMDEIRDIAAMAEGLDTVANVMLRMNPGISAHTHEYIMTSAPDSKFGMALCDIAEIAEAIKEAEKTGHFKFKGIHSHIGSQIFAKDAYIAQIQTMSNFIHDLESEYSLPVKEISLGGGFAAYYTQKDEPIPVDEVCRTIIAECEKQKDAFALSFDTLSIEPGRSIAGEAGYTVYTVGYGKVSAGKKYVFVDGGMGDNIRPALYGAEYRCDVISEDDNGEASVCTVAGKCCESGDVIINAAEIPNAKKGDLILVYTTGAYGYSMSSNYNRLPRPAVVFVNGAESRVVVKRETWEDVASHDVTE
ncbi:MAG: diaminopimelate decarboxylase [Clostridiales bacterium]|nr:diaminopimelate decarboxylase [Clostridiales bacterium]